MTRNGEPIEALPPKRRVETGIAYDDIRIELGLISEFEERDVAHAYGYRWDEWNSQSVRERAAHVAHSRIASLIRINVDDAAEEHARRERFKAAQKRQSG